MVFFLHVYLFFNGYERHVSSITQYYFVQIAPSKSGNLGHNFVIEIKPYVSGDPRRRDSNMMIVRLSLLRKTILIPEY